MSKPTLKPGDRVGVIVNQTDAVLTLAGYGVYQGERPLSSADVAGWVAVAIMEDDEHALNPFIKMDDEGEHAWGCEVWWAAEANVKTLEELFRRDRVVKFVKMSEVRAGLRKKQEKHS